MKMGNHMQMSLKGKPQPGDQQHVHQILAAARSVVAHYAEREHQASRRIQAG
jgi:hypothetical protein